jgi:multidrug efflux pump
VVVQSPDSPVQDEAHAVTLLEAAHASGRFMFVDTDLKIDMPQLRFVLDRDRIAELGLDGGGEPAALAVAVRVTTSTAST